MRAGYKQTEVGVIPEDWETSQVGDVCGCIVPGRNKPRLFDGDIPWITTPDLEDGKLIATSRLGLCISRAEAKMVGSKVVPPGSVLMSCAGELGIVALTQNEIVVNQQLHVFLPTSSIDGRFLLSALSYRKDQIASLGTKTAVPYLNKSSCNSISVPLPPLPEQRAIATALSDVDALLSKLEALIAKKRDLKQATMQQLLTGQTRLPGFSGVWEVRPLGSVVSNLEAGVSVNSVEHGKPLSSGEPCILKTSAIFDGRFDPEECKLIDRRDVCRAKLNPRRDTILVSRMNTPNLVGEVGFVAEDFPTLNLPDRLWMTRFDPCADICARWLTYVLSSAQVKESIRGLATGTSGSMKNIGKSALLALQLKFPTGDEQTAIATVLSDMDAELSALEARRDKTRALKQGMMQELLTGKIRLL